MYLIKGVISMKFILVHLRKSIRLLLVLLLGALLIGAILYFLYKPMYAVYLEGEVIGYTDDKSDLQDKINDYVKSGDGDKVAFYEIENIPSYEICYSKKDLKANDNEVFERVIEGGTPYYKQYAILVNKEEKYYVSDYDSVEKVISSLKKKKSRNINKITYSVKYTADKKLEETKENKIVAELYVKPKAKKSSISGINAATPSNNGITKNTRVTNRATKIIKTKRRSSSGFIFPVAGLSTANISNKRYPSYRGHTGVDVNINVKGRSVVAAKAGKVIVSEAKMRGGRYISYGEYIVIQHSDGKQTLYAHMRPGSRRVSVGQVVQQGQVIGIVGQTGRAYGEHLHFEVRINGRPVNPLNYLY